MQLANWISGKKCPSQRQKKKKKGSKKTGEAKAEWARQTAGKDIPERQKGKEISEKRVQMAEDYVGHVDYYKKNFWISSCFKWEAIAQLWVEK